jgi:hypothetical protein
VKRRSAIVFAVAAIVASIPVAVRVAAPAAQPRASLSAAQACGFDRWTVKTLQDRPPLLPTKSSSLSALGILPRPVSLPSARLPWEHRVYVVTAEVISTQAETDGDLHVVLSAGGRTMLGEAPNHACTAKATPFRRRQMEAARESIRFCRAQVTGVLFFDFALGQDGHAPNYAELHPLLAFRCLYPLRNAKPRSRPASARAGATGLSILRPAP